MTLQEFETWVDAHYVDLLKVARRRGAREPYDIVNTAVAQMLAHGGYADTDKPWTWACLYVRGAARDAREVTDNLQSFRRELKRSTPSLGRKRPAPRAD